MFKNVEAETYLKINLHLHILKNSENKQVAFQICRFIKQKRPYLQVENYI